MKSLLRKARRGGNVFGVLLAWSAAVAALDISLCASFNTASMGKKLDIYQTNGLCHDMCLKKNQAYAITQGNACWCSDYTPAKSKQVDRSECNQPCPAYPAENCGGPGVFGYILLNNVSPSGTKGGNPEPKPTPTQQADTPTSTAWVTKTVQDTATSPAPPPSSPSSSRRTLTSESTEETRTSSTTSETSTSAELPPATSIIQTVTAGGTIQTVTIIPLQTQSVVSNESNTSTDLSASKGGLGTGGVVGVVVGVIVAILGLAAIALFLYFQRKKRVEGDFQDDPSVRGSSSGMLGGRSEMSGVPGSPGSTGNRSSMLPVDPRMNPFQGGLYARNGSHESINTLRDDHDYSRRIQQPKVLRATNPDPTD